LTYILSKWVPAPTFEAFYIFQKNYASTETRTDQ